MYMSRRCCAFVRPRCSLGGGAAQACWRQRCFPRRLEQSTTVLRRISDRDKLGKVLRRPRIGWLHLEQAGAWDHWIRAWN